MIRQVIISNIVLAVITIAGVIFNYGTRSEQLNNVAQDVSEIRQSVEKIANKLDVVNEQTIRNSEDLKNHLRQQHEIKSASSR